MYARHALQQNMDPWALPQCLFKGMCMKKRKLVFSKYLRKVLISFSVEGI